MPTTDHAPGPAARRGVVTLAALGVAVVAFGFQQTAVMPALPMIQEDLRASRGWSAWLLSGYLVASSVFTPLVGKLGDRYGARRLLLGALVVFLVGSAGATLAPNLAVLVVCRAVQGVGGAVFPLTLALARTNLPDQQVQLGVSLLTGGFGLGTALGFGLSGVLVGLGSWRWIFGVGAAVLVLGTAVVAVFVPASAHGARIRLDLPGAALLAVGLALPLMAITEGQPRGWTSPWVIAAFVAGAAALVAWAAYDLRAAEPLLDLRLLARRPVLLTNMATIGLGFAMFGTYFLLPYLLRSPAGAGSGSSPLTDGLFLLPVAIGQTAAAPAAVPLARWITDRWALTLGLASATAASLGFALLHDSAVLVLLWSLLLGVGAGLGISIGSTIITRTAADAETGVATSMNSVLRRVGGGVGGQIGAAVTAGAVATTAAAANSAFVVAFGLCAVVAGIGALLAVGIAPQGARPSPRSPTPAS